jgi:hypothetical protein
LGHLKLDGSLPQPVPDVMLIQHYINMRAKSGGDLSAATGSDPQRSNNSGQTTLQSRVEPRRQASSATKTASAEAGPVPLSAAASDASIIRAVEPVNIVRRVHKKKAKKSRKLSPKVKRQPKTPQKVGGVFDASPCKDHAQRDH